MQPIVSIIICTRDRADSLRLSLASIGETQVPLELPAEVVVVDNGSSDDTKDVVRSSCLSHLPLRYVVEAKPGKSNAYNAGVSAAGGRILLSTDDDVRVPADWIGPMCRPILDGIADIVQGGIVPAEHLQRPWLRHSLNAVSATVIPDMIPVGKLFCVGANLAFSRAVVDRIKGFDPILGPGSEAGLCEDILFGYMAKEAGFRSIYAEGLPVIHHFDPDRLTLPAILGVAGRMGRSAALLEYHWSHDEKRISKKDWLILRAKLSLRAIQGLSRGEKVRESRYFYERELAYHGQLKKIEGQERRYTTRATQAILDDTPP